MTNGLVAPEIFWKLKIGVPFGCSLQQTLKVMLQIRHSSNRGAVQFRIAPVVRGLGTWQIFATAAAVERSTKMPISDVSKITKRHFY